MHPTQGCRDHRGGAGPGSTCQGNPGPPFPHAYPHLVVVEHLTDLEVRPLREQIVVFDLWADRFQRIGVELAGIEERHGVRIAH